MMWRKRLEEGYQKRWIGWRMLDMSRFGAVNWRTVDTGTMDGGGGMKAHAVSERGDILKVPSQNSFA